MTSGEVTDKPTQSGRYQESSIDRLSSSEYKNSSTGTVDVASPAMTSKNLNRSKIQILIREYTEDLAAGLLHPISYLLYDRKFNTDLIYVIPNKIGTETLRLALITYIRERTEQPSWSNENLQVRPRKRPSDD
ncbi:hypothetical protein BT63DRAFT_153695 [Microthyrium microscopicum]|uniref:Uncharacterized protein n=1 Tax=Microthyrium microscopicum TaxID=703497 RepID=A0A6A6UPI7_9PEZI|nr:hypothetical protein BT63DRAFT_153695 [Microthyrium microscopicum]